MHMETGEKIELSVIMPCLNEESTVGYCVDEALQFSYDMVIGNRYEGGMERGAMPLTPKLRTVRDGIRHLRYIYTGKKYPVNKMKRRIL